MNFFKHIGKQEVKFELSVIVHDVERVPSNEMFTCTLKRGSKSFSTTASMSEQDQVRWEEQISFVTTLYTSKKERSAFDSKLFTISIKPVRVRRGNQEINHVIRHSSKHIGFVFPFCFELRTSCA
jgi:hypothetical protein